MFAARPEFDIVQFTLELRISTPSTVIDVIALVTPPDRFASLLPIVVTAETTAKVFASAPTDAAAEIVTTAPSDVAV
tara:strand:- start:196 stop:426 length:231 start_codon:yes stop_codon:yes gene_type:complete